MQTPNDLPVLFFANGEQWREWLHQHHAQPSGVWLQLAKKAAKIKSVTYDEALDVALCYGWIDGQLRPRDAEYYIQKFTPRRAKSVWSKRNVAKVAALTKAGLMQPSGIAEIEAAKKDGRWQQAYDSPSNMTVPADFQAALDQNPAAKAMFATLNKTNAYSFLWRIQTAKKSETRQARIAQFVQMLQEGKTFHPSKSVTTPGHPQADN